MTTRNSHNLGVDMRSLTSAPSAFYATPADTLSVFFAAAIPAVRATTALKASRAWTPCMALTAFMATATASQLKFIGLIVQYLTENGVMDAARLYESPFTDIRHQTSDISQQGPEASFLPVRVTEMVRVLEEIRERAVA